jgi:hypothetical protein
MAAETGFDLKIRRFVFSSTIEPFGGRLHEPLSGKHTRSPTQTVGAISLGGHFSVSHYERSDH